MGNERVTETSNEYRGFLSKEQRTRAKALDRARTVISTRSGGLIGNITLHEGTTSDDLIQIARYILEGDTFDKTVEDRVSAAWDEGFEAGATWHPSGPTGVPSDPPPNPYLLTGISKYERQFQILKREAAATAAKQEERNRHENRK